MKPIGIHTLIQQNRALYDMAEFTFLEKIHDLNIVSPSRLNGQYKKLLAKYPDVMADLIELTRFAPADMPFKERLMLVVDGWIAMPSCSGCGNPTTFNAHAQRWNKYCGAGCVHLDSNAMASREHTMMQRYGARHQNQSAIVQERRKSNALDKYGEDHHNKVLKTHFSDLTDEQRGVYAARREAAIRNKYGNLYTNPSQVHIHPEALLILNDPLEFEAMCHFLPRRGVLTSLGVTEQVLYDRLAKYGIAPRWGRGAVSSDVGASTQCGLVNR